MLWIAGVVFKGWLGMFALIMGMRMAIVVAVERPPVPDRVRIPFEILHMTVAGLAGGWVCARFGRDQIMLCAVILALWCAMIEVISLRLGYTTFDRAHSLAGIVIGPLSVIASALLLTG